jgi:hypothetical protein
MKHIHFPNQMREGMKQRSEATRFGRRTIAPASHVAARRAAPDREDGFEDLKTFPIETPAAPRRNGRSRRDTPSTNALTRRRFSLDLNRQRFGFGFYRGGV